MDSQEKCFEEHFEYFLRNNQNFFSEISKVTFF